VADQLAQARALLGQEAPQDVVIAAATALRGGVPATTLARVQRELSGRSIVVPFAVLGVLAARGVPATLAADVVVAEARRDTDERLLALGREAVQRITAGVPPAFVLGAMSNMARPGQYTSRASATTGSLSGSAGGRPPQPKPKP
jgi:protein-disulfide isomerase-like protein with CxxC motif